MGRPKLILPVGGETVIVRVVRALVEGGAAPVVVVTPPPDAPGALVLIREAGSAGAEVLSPGDRPVDMRASVERALAWLGQAGRTPSSVLVCPADSPGLSAGLVARVIARAKDEPGSIVVPVLETRRGHPVAIPWDVAQQIPGLPAGMGVNALFALRTNRVVEVPVNDAGAVCDLDTPEDYRQWAGTGAVEP
jgi:molybdenum cofactor cytidylyltransferase